MMTRHETLVLGAVLLVSGCAASQTTRRTEVIVDHGVTSDATSQILQVISDYAAALERGDAELWESLFRLNDPAFSMIENDRPHLMGREYIETIAEAIRQRGPQPDGQKWYATHVHLISDDIAYTTSLRDETFPDGAVRTSRVTLILKRSGNQWRILHGHFSFIPG